MKARPRHRHRRLAEVFAAVLLCVAAAGCGSSDSRSASNASSASASASTPPVSAKQALPSSIVVLGHSGGTGFNSDPNAPRTDAKQNSWATGDNASVQSIYTRVLAQNPAVRDHAANLAVDGTKVDDLARQAEQALAIEPRPDLFLIETVSNDIRCDGSDESNYEPFAAAFQAVLAKITAAAPNARIFIASSPWSTTERYLQVVQQLPSVRAASAGTGPCDLFTPAGDPAPDHQSNLEAITKRYLDLAAASCAMVPTCRYDGGALHDIAITPQDVTPDGYHLTVSGLTMEAALEWSALAL